MNRVRIISRKYAISKDIMVPPIVKINARNRRKNAAENQRYARKLARLAVAAEAAGAAIEKFVASVSPSMMSRDALRKLAAERKIAGRGSMTKAELIEALS